MRATWKHVLGTFVSAAILEALPAAQCPAPDHLDGGPCCSAASPRIPGPRKFRQGSLSICWKDCDVALVERCAAVWNPRTPAITVGGGAPGPCDPRQTTLVLRDGAGTVKWGGLFTAVYSRTWLETDGAGRDYQVWRFLLNGDMRPSAAAGPRPCPVPPCAAAIGRVRFTGYVDTARECSTGTLQYAWMLTHACDRFEHTPGFPRAGAFHPEFSYTFVGPGGSFVPGPLQPLEGGTSRFEAVRRIRLSSPAVCEHEQPLVFGTLDPLQELCACASPAGGKDQFLLGALTVETVCGTRITTSGGPHLPGYLSMGLGRWTDPRRYPGPESLRWTVGNYDVLDGCSGATRNEVFFGVTTLRGFRPSQVLGAGVPGPLPSTFVDQANSVDPATGATLMNVPFASNTVLNLNP